MNGAMSIGVGGAVLLAAAGACLTVALHSRRVRAGTPAGGSAVLARWRRTRDHLRSDLGIAGAFAVTAAGLAVTCVIGWPVGRLAKALETTVDRPVFSWFQARNGAGWWRSLQQILTQMGDRPEIKTVAVVAAVVLATAWRRRWWVPVVVIAAAYVLEKYVQQGLGNVVLRGHPPTTRGTYPSGGCARLISMYGTVLWLALRTWRPNWRVRGLLWTALAEAAWLEGYARTFLLQHWVTDVVGGWIVGSLLLATLVLTASALAVRGRARAGYVAAARRSSRRTAQV